MVTDSLRYSGIALVIVAGSLLSNSCIGPAGPPGQDGDDGIDAAATCQICHNNDIRVVSRQEQLEFSLHQTGGNYERSRSTCAACHTHQGFMETHATDGITTAADIENPTSINCRTCHLIHVNFNEEDWQLVTTAPVSLQHGEAVVDLGGPSNLCAKCHQSRSMEPGPEPGGGPYTITSGRYGPHHGPQSNNLWGVGGYEIPGSMGYPPPGTHPHAGVGCVRCHMAPLPYGGRMAGGHTFNMTYEYAAEWEQNVDACTECHPGLGSFDFNGVQSQVWNLMTVLEEYFISRGWMDGPGELWNVPIEGLSDNELGAMLNYKTALEDRSLGIHNPGYLIALLNNSLESLP